MLFQEQLSFNVLLKRSMIFETIFASRTVLMPIEQNFCLISSKIGLGSIRKSNRYVQSDNTTAYLFLITVTQNACTPARVKTLNRYGVFLVQLILIHLQVSNLVQGEFLWDELKNSILTQSFLGSFRTLEFEKFQR